MPRGRRPKNRQQIAPSFAVPHVRRPRSRGRRERRGAADPGDEDPGDERARNRPDPLSLGSALRGAALAFLLCRERHDGSPAEVRDSSVGSASSGGHGDKRRTTRGPYIFRLAEGLAKRSPSSMLCNTTSSLIVRGAESAVHYGEAAQRGLTPC